MPPQISDTKQGDDGASPSSLLRRLRHRIWKRIRPFPKLDPERPLLDHRVDNFRELPPLLLDLSTIELPGQSRTIYHGVSVQQVFHCAELLEEILLYLPPRVLLRVQRVSKYRRNTMQGSRRIQIALWSREVAIPEGRRPARLKPIKSSTKGIVGFNTNAFQHAADIITGNVVVNPFFRIAFPSSTLDIDTVDIWRTSSDTNAFDGTNCGGRVILGLSPTDAARFAIFNFKSSSFGCMILCSAFPRPDYEMNLFQLSIKFSCAFENHYFLHLNSNSEAWLDKSRHREPLTVEHFARGASMGSIMSRASIRMDDDAHCNCSLCVMRHPGPFLESDYSLFKEESMLRPDEYSRFDCVHCNFLHWGWKQTPRRHRTGPH